MPINFPDSPTTGDTHTSGDKTWTYDGTAWNLVVGGVPTVVDTLTINQDAEVDGILTANHIHGNIAGSVYLHVKNTSGVTIPAGSPVYATGSVGASGATEVAASDASTAATMPALGITQSELVANAEGHATILGVIGSLDTSTYGLNDSLYVAPGGGLTDTRPTALTDLVQKIGRVVRVDGSTGEILVLGAGRTNDVPNNVVVGGLTVDTNTLHVDSTNNRVGIVTTTPAYTLDVKGQVQIGADDNITPDALGNGHLMIDGAGYTGFASLDGTAMWVGHNSGGRNLYLATDETARVTVTGGGNVGIGTTSPSYKLHVRGGSSNDTTPEFVIDGNGNMAFHNGLGQGSFNGIVQAGDKGIIFSDGSVNTGEFVIAPWASGTGGMRIDSSGNTAFGGYVSQPREFFRAYRRGNQGWSLTGVQTIVFEYTVFNNGNNYSTSTGRFTAPVAGYYHLGAHFFKYTTYSNSTNTYWGIFTSNGYSTTTNHGTAGQDGGQSLNCIVYMGANDYADVQITSAGSTIQSYGTMSFNSFYGYLLSA